MTCEEITKNPDTVTSTPRGGDETKNVFHDITPAVSPERTRIHDDRIRLDDSARIHAGKTQLCVGARSHAPLTLEELSGVKALDVKRRGKCVFE